MAKFKCKLSGTVVSFEYAHDIEAMHKHPQYEFVEDKPVKVEGLVKEKQVQVKPVSSFKD